MCEQVRGCTVSVDALCLARVTFAEVSRLAFFLGWAGVPSSVRPLKVAGSASAGSSATATSSAVLTGSVAGITCGVCARRSIHAKERAMAIWQAHYQCLEEQQNGGTHTHLRLGLFRFPLLSPLLLSLSFQGSSNPCKMNVWRSNHHQNNPAAISPGRAYKRHSPSLDIASQASLRFQETVYTTIPAQLRARRDCCLYVRQV